MSSPSSAMSRRFSPLLSRFVEAAALAAEIERVDKMVVRIVMAVTEAAEALRPEPEPEVVEDADAEASGEAVVGGDAAPADEEVPGETPEDPSEKPAATTES